MRKQVTITFNNNVIQIGGDITALEELQEAPSLKVKHPQAYFIRKYMPPGWDGWMRAVRESGRADPGFFTRIIEYCDNNEIDYEIVDRRVTVPSNIEIPLKVGKLVPRAYQVEAVKAVLTNKVGGISYPLGGIKAATNAGKTLMMAMIHKSVPGAKTIMLLNDGDLFEQFKTEIPELLGDDVGFVRGQKDTGWDASFVVAMVQTVSRNLNRYKGKLEEFNVVLVDEYDLAANTTYKKVLKHCWNASVKVGLSGTVYMGKLAKHKLGHFEIRKFFGEVLFEITKRELVEKGVSTNLVIKIVPTGNQVSVRGDWKEEYNLNITENDRRIQTQLVRMDFNISHNRLPALVMGQFHDHIHRMYEAFKEAYPKLKVDYVHGDRKGRDIIIEEFRKGEVDILIGSFILRRGKNFPLIRYIQQAAGSDSPETISQIMGRGERKHKDKKKTVIDDFFDEGYYLQRHSKHRINYYKDEGFTVIDLRS